MSGGNLWNYLFENFIQYIIGGLTVFYIAKGAGKGSTGEAVWAIVIGLLAYWFGKDPGAALQTIATIWDKIKSTGGGA